MFRGNVADVEDAKQEIIIAMYQDLPGFRGDASFMTYLYRYARNKVVSLLREASLRALPDPEAAAIRCMDADRLV